MDQSQLTHTTDDAEADQNHGKSSVMKKVRAKARKLKHSVLSKHSHGHDAEPASPKDADDDNDQFYDEDDNDDDDAEMVDDPQIHSAVKKDEVHPQLPTSSPMTGPHHHGNELGRSTDPSPAGEDPIIKSFENLSVQDDTDSKAFQTPRAGITHDSDLSPTTDLPESPSAKTGGGYADKLSYATSTLTDRAISAKNAVASKLGYGGASTGKVTDPANETKTEDVADRGVESVETQPSKGYVAAVSEKLAPVYSKVAGVGTTVRSKLPGTGTGTGPDSDPAIETTEDVANRGVETTEGGGANKGYVAAVSEKLAPVYNKVAGVGTTVRSKLPGSGTGTDPAIETTEGVANRGVETTESGGATKGYGATVSEKLAPVYNRVAGVGATMMSKLPGTGTETDPATNETAEGVANRGIETTEGGGPNKGYGAAVSEKLSPVYNRVAGAGNTIMSKFSSSTDRGVGSETTKEGGSLTEYLSEKLKPGEEDKALSEVISGTLYKRKEEEGGVKETLGGTVDEQQNSPGSGGGGVGVVGRVKSWFGKEGNASPTSSPRGETAIGHEHQQQQQEEVIGDRKLQESSN